MAGIIELKPGVTWLGARHPELRIFDELFPTRHGSTYNSYLVRGTKKTALIDTVKAPFTEEFIEKLRSQVPLEQIDLVVVNHTEPDHSGALGRLLELNPEITVYCTRPGENFLKQLFEQPMKTHPVAEGEEIDLGGKTLRFILAPSLHWPDTMFTYLPEDRILFSCDAFGAHFCSDQLYDDEAGDFTAEFEQYFDVIMRPFKDKIREAVAKVEGLPIELLCPSHGPVRRSNPKAVIARYGELAAAPPASAGKRALVLTLSPHGNTRQMARSVSAGLQAQGVEVAEHSLVETDPQTLRDEFERCDALVVGTPTINRDAPGPVWNALALLSSVTPKGKLGAVFGSFGWSGEAVKLVEERLKGLKYTLPVAGLTYRFKPTDKDIHECREFGEQVGKVLVEA